MAQRVNQCLAIRAGFPWRLDAAFPALARLGTKATGVGVDCDLPHDARALPSNLSLDGGSNAEDGVRDPRLIVGAAGVK